MSKPPRDVLCFMSDRQLISRLEFDAGCIWQSNLAAVTLQPGGGVDWSQWFRFQRLYQQRGGPSESQAEALTRRKKWWRELGHRRARLLDAVLNSSADMRSLRAIYGRTTYPILDEAAVVLHDLSGIIGDDRPATFKLGEVWPLKDNQRRHKLVHMGFAA